MDDYNHILDKAYEKYRLDWMRSHGHTLEEMFNLMEGVSFSEWEKDYGFGGELWVCREEFANAEFLDTAYMRNLLNPLEWECYKQLMNVKTVFIQTEAFLTYLKATFSETMDDPWGHDLICNVLTESQKEETRENVLDYLTRVIPEVTRDEIETFLKSS